MNRRRTLYTILLVVVLLLIIVFVFVGLPLIQDMFATPIPGFPTGGAPTTSLQQRFTETAAAKAAGTSATPGATSPAPTAAATS